MKKYLLLFSLFIIGLSSCKKGDVVSQQAAIDDAKIQAYIKANNINATKDPSGLYYEILVQGAGAKPTSSSTVELTYNSKLLNGTIVEGLVQQNIILSGATLGFQVGVPLVQSGINGSNNGRILLIMPSRMAYGTVVQTSIPANSVLIYTIDVLGIASN